MGLEDAGNLDEEYVYYIRYSQQMKAYQIMDKHYENRRRQRAAQKWWFGLGVEKMRVVSEKGPKSSTKPYARQKKDERNWSLKQHRAADRCKIMVQMARA